VIPENHLEFLQVVWTRRPTYTYVFFAFNILIFVLMVFAGGSTNESTLMAFGVKSNFAIAHGQWWRFVTPIFIHIGLLHIFFNSYALWIVGPQVEKLYGGARFVLIYILTGIAGVYGSYRYHPGSISAGASGAIFGLFGVLLVFGIRYRNSIPPFFKRAVGTGVLPVIVINLIIGFTLQGVVDNSAHLSGLIAGAILASIVPFQKPGGETHRAFEAIQVALLLLVAVSFYQVAAHYDGPRLSVRNLGRGFTQVLSTGSAPERFIDAINTAQETFEAASQDLEAERMDHLESAGNAMAKSIEQLRKIPSLAATPDKLAKDLMRVMMDQYALIYEVKRSGTLTLIQHHRLKDNSASYEKIVSEFSKWAETDGGNYGIQMQKGR
jgi:membrane associated rhomboid family serine protease